MAGHSEGKGVVLVTGSSGFTGYHLRQVLEARGWRVVGIDKGDSSSDTISCDLLDRGSLAKILREVSPQAVLHLAGIASVDHSKINELYLTNLVGSHSLLEACAALDRKPATLVLASSANVYGNTFGRTLDEATPPVPTNDYAVSKLAMEYMARTFAVKLPITIARPFNYTGRGQASRFVIPKVIEHFKRRSPFIELGNIDVVREFSDVRRVVEAYARLLEVPGSGEIFNICSGIGISLREVISVAETLTNHRIEVRMNPDYVRDNEVTELVGSCEKLEKAVGALPVYKIQDTLEWMLQD